MTFTRAQLQAESTISAVVTAIADLAIGEAQSVDLTDRDVAVVLRSMPAVAEAFAAVAEAAGCPMPRAVALALV